MEPFEGSIDGVFVNVVGDGFVAESASDVVVLNVCSWFCCAFDGLSVDKYSVSSASDKLVVKNL